MDMDNAKEEKDHEKKTKLYLIAEKVLQRGWLIHESGAPEKREQVLRLLEKVREERELAISMQKYCIAVNRFNNYILHRSDSNQ